MINVALWDAIEEQLGGTPGEMHGKRRIRTPFNRARREQKIKNIEAHCARHPGDKQSETHGAQMAKRLTEGRQSKAALARA